MAQWVFFFKHVVVNSTCIVALALVTSMNAKPLVFLGSKMFLIIVHSKHTYIKV